MKYFIKFGLFLALVAFFCACNHRVFYEKIDHFSGEEWFKDSVLNYQLEITDSMEFYNIFLTVRNSTDYQTQMLYVFFTTEFPTGALAKDTLGCIIANPRGEWTGKGKGRLRDNEFLLKENVRFPIKGRYQFTVEQAMRADPLTGIESFGIRFDEVK